MTKALLLVGSPRGKKSASTIIGEPLINMLKEKGMETKSLWLVRHFLERDKIKQVLEAMNWADIVLLAAPLYDDCQPFVVVKTMEAVAKSGLSMADKRFFSIINCGFAETKHITAVSISIYRRFAESVGFIWAGSLAVGGGEMFRASAGKTLLDSGPFGKKMLKTLKGIAPSLVEGRPSSDAVFELPKIFQSKLIMRMGNYAWKARTKKNGSRVDARPYDQDARVNGLDPD